MPKRHLLKRKPRSVGNVQDRREDRNPGSAGEVAGMGLRFGQMARCTNCYAELPKGSRWCRNCGYGRKR
jgi:hypothetical protein